MVKVEKRNKTDSINQFRSAVSALQSGKPGGIQIYA